MISHFRLLVSWVKSCHLHFMISRLQNISSFQKLKHVILQNLTLHLTNVVRLINFEILNIIYLLIIRVILSCWKYPVDIFKNLCSEILFTVCTILGNILWTVNSHGIFFRQMKPIFVTKPLSIYKIAGYRRWKICLLMHQFCFILMWVDSIVLL